MTLLSLEKVDKVFGGLRALKQVSFSVPERSIFGLIGPNGAGKTTLFNVITGVYTPDGGQILFQGQSIGGEAPAKIGRRGIARTFQNIRLFRAMTVEENVMVAGHHLHRASLLSAMFRTRAHAEDEARLQKRARELLDVLGLGKHAKDVAGSLPYGSQRRLEIARALMLEPKLLLLDEPAAGMNSQEAAELERQIRYLRDEMRLTIVLVEHNMAVVMSVCEAVHVVDHGETIAHGSPEHVRQDPAVLAAYLGKSTEGAA
ncbi:MAG: Branched-chain amino acid transport ATP-binding protein LivG [Polyangiaceae bacterium]|jgi:branched-chain amino acid transport system ATP-binding protein|nr:Branched-chain amino acid transport ATP-binding protein LivG [Polyangiaceae bacterium]